MVAVVMALTHSCSVRWPAEFKKEAGPRLLCVDCKTAIKGKKHKKRVAKKTGTIRLGSNSETSQATLRDRSATGKTRRCNCACV